MFRMTALTIEKRYNVYGIYIYIYTIHVLAKRACVDGQSSKEAVERKSKKNIEKHKKLEKVCLTD